MLQQWDYVAHGSREGQILLIVNSNGFKWYFVAFNDGGEDRFLEDDLRLVYRPKS